MTEKSLIKPHVIKVEGIGDFFRREISPRIRLKGQWLLDAGLKPETHVKITSPQPGVLVVKNLE